MSSKKARKTPEAEDAKTKLSQHLAIRKIQQQIANRFASEKPSTSLDTYWIYSFRQKGEYPESNINGGKWLVFVDVKDVDTLWNKIKLATEEGLLGESSKVSTAKSNPNAKSDKKVICIYTYDYTDRDDVLRIRNELRKIGVINKIPYKTDIATREGRYEIKGDTKISTYYE